MGDRTRDATRLERILEDASIKLSAVASSVTTVSAREMLAALVAGDRYAAAMAAHRASTPTTRCWSRRCCTGWITSEAALAEVDASIATAMEPSAHRGRGRCAPSSAAGSHREPGAPQ